MFERTLAFSSKVVDSCNEGSTLQYEDNENFICLHIAVFYLPPNSNSLLKQKFADSLSTV